MPTQFKDYLLLMAGLCLSTLVIADSATPSGYIALSREHGNCLSIEPTELQQHWLKNRSRLVLGTSAPDYPPFDITNRGRIYEGLTADYAGIVAQTLDLPLEVLRFNSRAAAMQALEDGEIDLLGSANGFEATHQNIRLSTPYAVDQPVLVTRKDETRSRIDPPRKLRMSMVHHYLPMDIVKALYPSVTVQLYPSLHSAMNAVAFEQADAFLGDTLSAHYVISKGQLSNIQMTRFGKHEANGFSFAVRHDNLQLLELINQALAATPASQQESILKRWSPGSDILLKDQKLHLSKREQHWLSAHPVVRVLAPENLAPVSFFDAEGTFRGISADLLELIRMRTGLRFEVQQASNDQQMVEGIDQRQADIIAAITPALAPQTRLDFSRPYLKSPSVLLTRKTADAPATLEQMAGKRIAINQANPLITFLREHHPDISLIETPDILSATKLLADNQVEGSVAPLLLANYYRALSAFESLRISATVGTHQEEFTLATADTANELGSLLDKALLSITPVEMELINSRWSNYKPDANDYWRKHSRLIYQVIGTATLLLSLSLIWNAYMRQQIRQRQIAERALNDQIEFMHVLINLTPHPIYVRDCAGRLTTCNDSYLKTFSVAREDVIGKDVIDSALHGELEALQYQADYQRVLKDGTPQITDRPLRVGTRTLTIYHWILPYRDSLGEIQGIIGGWVDISERRQLIEKMRVAKTLADEASRAKSTFLATMSHEIRTPMNAVIGMLELTLKRADQGHFDRPSIEIAYNSATDLLELIGDILDIARIESGRLSLSPERVNLRELVSSVVRVFDGLARQKSLTLQLEFNPAHGTEDVLLDPLRFKQILSNLISNAIKFTERGQITVKISLTECTTSENVQLELKVQDGGIGISQEDQQHLFQPFAQADNSGQLARSGAGLGLVICRSLCEMMGGTLALHSTLGVGTQVTVALGLERLTSPPPTPAIAPPTLTTQQTLSVLVVDDHPANRLLMCQQLGFIGHLCEVAENGRAGLDKWMAGAFDLVIADCNMPVMNGYDLTKAIREHERLNQLPHCQVFGFTANAQQEERTRCLAAGMDDCLFKPISLAALHERLANLQSQRTNDPFDLRGLDAMTGGDPSLVSRLLNELLKSNRLDRLELQKAAQGQDLSALIEIAHRIKGAARIIKAMPLIEHCEHLEQLCQERASADIILPARLAVEQALITLDKALLHQLASATPPGDLSAQP